MQPDLTNISSYPITLRKMILGLYFLQSEITRDRPKGLRVLLRALREMSKVWRLSFFRATAWADRRK